MTILILIGLTAFKLKLLSFKKFIRVGITIYLSLFICLCFTTGGIKGPNIWWLITTPVVASNFVSKKETLFWSVTSLLMTLLTFTDIFQANVINEVQTQYWEYFELSSVLALAIVFASTGYFSISTREKIQEENEQAMAAANHASNLSSLGEMAGGIAHEINNPLMIISGSARGIEKNLQKENPDIEKINKKIETIKRSTERMAAIIKGLKTLARDGVNDEVEAVTISETIDDIISFMSSKFSHENIQFNYDRQDSLFQLAFPLYKVQFSQVILNLLSNSFYAIKDQDDAWIKIEMEKYQDHYRVRISDSGKGIPEEIIAKIFTPFFTSKPVGEGTGLGLPLCHSIMVKCGGDLFYDQESSNTSFVIVLPKPLKLGQHQDLKKVS